MRGKAKTFKRKLNIFSCNSNGLKSKLQSLENLVNNIRPSVFAIQESHMSKIGQIKFESSKNYQIYEHVRFSKNGGGLALGIIKELEPVWIKDGDENVEALTVRVTLGNNVNVRVTNVYGPQEYDNMEKKQRFWEYLNKEVFEAKIEGSGCIILMDGNSWLGPEIIPEDPHLQNGNGKLFESFLKNNTNMFLWNGKKLCTGNITRARETNNCLERSIIDFIIVCDSILPFVKKMVIDEEKIYSLTNYSSKRKGKPPTHSDHNSIILDINMRVKKYIPERKLVYNYRDVEAMKKFRMVTTNDDSLIKCFETNESLEMQSKKWLKSLNNILQKSFRKIRLNKPKKIQNDEMSICFNKRKKAILSKQHKIQDEAENEIKQTEAERNIYKIRNNLKEVENNPNSKQTGIWKLKNKFFPKKQSPLPSAKYNSDGQIITNQHELKILYLDHFHHRLRERPIRPDLKFYKEQIEKEFKSILKITAKNKFPDWTLTDLEKVIKSLKKSQSPDSFGIVNEVFINCGENMKMSILHLCNKVKNVCFIPDFFQSMIISSIPKKKKSPLNLLHQRGIFLTPKIKSVLMKLV